MVAFKNPREKSQFSHLARQLYPENSKFLMQAYLMATNVPHGYLFVDLKQATPEKEKVKTDIFDKYPVVFTPK